MVTPFFPLEVGCIIVFALTLTGAAWKALNWVWLRPKKLERFLRQQGLNGNSYRLLHGDFKEMHGMLMEAYSKPIGLSDDFVIRVLGYEQQVVNTYGKNCFIWAGTIPRIIIMHPDQIKDIFSKIYDFQKPSSESNPIVMLLVKGLFNYEGDKWAMHRKIINPAFNLEKLKLMLPAFYSCCNELVTKWEGLLMDKEFVELDVWPSLQNLTRDAISRTAFGSSYEEGKRVFELQAEQAEYAVRSAQTVYIPGMRFLPTKTNRRMKKIHKEVESLLRGMISKREKAMKEGEAGGEDLLGLLLESNMKEIQENNKNMGMSILDVIEECKLFYLAGQETTSSLLAWTMFFLSVHPQWQTRARDEVLQVFGRNKKPDFDGLNYLKIVTMILYEVMRLYPPISLLGRQVSKDTKLGNLTIPAGAQVLLPVALIHHDKELWGENAKEFKPERFSEGISKATKNRVCYVPFGWGPRICIGQNFALIETKMAIVMILQRFMFELSPSYAHAPISGLSLQPQHGIQVILRRY